VERIECANRNEPYSTLISGDALTVGANDFDVLRQGNELRVVAGDAYVADQPKLLTFDINGHNR
jgi:hypothetical protein